ncbi:MAG: FecR domain-containing protein [Tannerellaceae bacterium]|jgi:ferric-dicitrate binding protein FerR (iron transport regulator)|nr:FecR domain-containing protein [Tannerellaceae bacterium]
MNKKNCLPAFERYLRGEATRDDIKRLKSFFENDAGLGKWMEEGMENASGIISPDIQMRMLENIRSRTGDSAMPHASAGGKKRYAWLRPDTTRAIAACLLPAVILFAAWLYLKPRQAASLEVIANKGEKASLTLTEGTMVAINSDSKITYPDDYNRKNRFLRLEGEAYFDVKHDPEKPFIVECEDIQIRVLGTSFGIKAYDDEKHIAIVLNTGKIQLTTPVEKIEMAPDERILYDKTTRTATREKVNADDYTAWRQNRLRFENESLETIMKTISRMHNIDIVFESLHLANMRFTGTIDNTSIKSVLEAIMLTSSINYRSDDGIVYLYRYN